MAVINLSARNYSITVAGLDVTTCLTSGEGNYEHYDQSGLSLINAKFVLKDPFRINESFNHRTNSRWARGNKIDVYIADDTGEIKRSPIIGWLYILNATPNAQLTEITIEAGCILNLLNFRTPAGDGVCIEFGNIVQLDTIAFILLQKAGCPLPYIGTIPGAPLTHPLPKLTNESYIQLLGKLAWSNGCICFQTNDGKIKAKKVNLFPAALLRRNVYQAVIYEYLNGAESPCEKITVTGTLKVYKDAKDAFKEHTEELAPLLTVNPEAPAGTRLIIVEVIDREEVISRDRRIKTIKTVTKRPIGSVMPEKFKGQTQLIFAEKTEEIYYYELPPNAIDPCKEPDEGRLLKSVVKIWRTWGEVFRDFEAKKEEVEGNTYVPPPWTGLVIAEINTTNYEYHFEEIDSATEDDDPAFAVSGSGGWTVVEAANGQQGFISIQNLRSQPALKITTSKQEPLCRIFPDLGDPDPDGDGTQLIITRSNATELLESERKTQEWLQLRKFPDEWRLTEKEYKLYGIAYPEKIEALREEGVAQIQTLREALIYIEKKTYSSNSGQYTPPAPERFPPEEDLVEEKQVIETVYFPPVFGYLFREREREFTIDSDFLTSEAQATEVAKIEGAILYGKWKGQSCTIDLAQEMFNNFSPLSRCDWTEVDGTVNAFLMDGASIAMAINRVAISFDGIWMGAVVTQPVLDPITGIPVLDPITGNPVVEEDINPPYTPTTQLSWGMGLGFNLQWFDYELDTGSTNLQWGMGMGWMLTTEAIPMTTLEWGMGMGFQSEDGGLLQDEDGDFLLDENGDFLLEG